MQEILDGLDAHQDNLEKFNLPSRLIAKKFLFRLIYGGQAYSYAHDADFDGIGNTSFWEEVIERTYKKYYGLHNWHTRIMQEVSRTGQLTIPSGRQYYFKRYPNFRGELEWPRTLILNYPVNLAA